ncbi:MAG: putative lipid II flippase FtsW [Elusimicrobia bacterium]|nr:MAG: putative lipid II flippase FtsW [Elusimicrobiota bacterium]
MGKRDIKTQKRKWGDPRYKLKKGLYTPEYHRGDIFLLSVVLFLVFIGVVMVFSASAIVSHEKFDTSYLFLIKQIIWTVMGVFLMLVLARIDYNKLQKFSRPLMVFSFSLLVLVLLIESGEIKRWLKFGMVNFQPSEMAKICLILYIADVLDRKGSKLQDFKKGLLPILAVAGIFLILIYAEPDLGTAVILGLVVLAMLFMGGVRLFHLLSLVLASIPLLYFAVFHVAYRRERILTFINPWADAQRIGYQIVQALLALGSGGFFGKGLGASRAKLFFLPEPYTDFIFSIIGEELGFLGASLIIFLFVIIAWRGLYIATRAPNQFGNLLAAGITFLITFQAVLNISIVTACLPTKGITLPFLSYGGSSLVFSLAGVGILLNISRQT